MSDWQPIETADKGRSFETVLGCHIGEHGDCEIRTTHWDHLEGAWMKDRSYEPFSASRWAPQFWMPLPDPPVVGCEDAVSLEPAQPLPSAAQK